MGIFIIAYSIGAQSKLSDEDAKNFLKEFQQAIQGIGAIGIFTHNITVALPMFIPAFGIAWGSFAAWSTGMAFSALVSTNPILSKLPPLAVLLISPFGIMELVAYSIGMSRSLLLTLAIIKKNPLKAEIRFVIIEVGIVIALLLAAAFIESAMISKYGSNIINQKS